MMKGIGPNNLGAPKAPVKQPPAKQVREAFRKGINVVSSSNLGDKMFPKLYANKELDLVNKRPKPKVNENPLEELKKKHFGKATVSKKHCNK